jgi:hypothetical protein
MDFARRSGCFGRFYSFDGSLFPGSGQALCF